jgi:deoxyribonuclease-1
MDWSKINPHKTKIIAGSAVAAVAIGAGAVLLGVKPISNQNTVQPSPSNQSAQATPETDLKIKGNKQSRIYHLPRCPNYNDIAERNIIWFKTKEEAEARKFRMAKNCP